MSTKAELLAEAKELGLEFTEGVTNAEIQKAIDEKKAENGEENTTTTPENEENGADVTPAELTEPAPAEEPTDPEPTPEEVETAKKAEREAAEAKAKADAEQKAMEEEQARLEAEAKAEKPSEGSEIAAAIREGLSANKEDKRIKITSDKHVQSMFSVVRSKKTGEVMIRENATGVLSKVQLKSLEEKEADLQSEEVEEL